MDKTDSTTTTAAPPEKSAQWWTPADVTDEQARTVCHLSPTDPVAEADRVVTAADFNGTNTPKRARIELPSIETYGNYSSDNYGAHALRVSIAGVDVYFSYKTPVAFRTSKTGLVVRENDWRQTTGKHLNAIDGGNKKARVSGSEFERLFAEAMNGGVA